MLADVTDRAEVEEPLKYPEDSAGGLMSTDVVSVREDVTVAGAIDAIRRQCEEDESQLYQIYAVDSGGDLRGIVPVSRSDRVAPRRKLVARRHGAADCAGAAAAGSGRGRAAHGALQRRRQCRL